MQIAGCSVSEDLSCDLEVELAHVRCEDPALQPCIEIVFIMVEDSDEDVLTLAVRLKHDLRDILNAASV